MQDQKRKNFFEITVMAMLTMVVFTAGTLFASSTKRLEGTVKTVADDAVTIATADHKEQTVQITSATKFLNHSKPGSLSDLKPGMHVVFRVKPTTSTVNTTSSATPAADTTAADTSSANSSSKSANTQKDKLSLSIGFTAVQASY
jgi:hypothetical protein